MYPQTFLEALTLLYNLVEIPWWHSTIKSRCRDFFTCVGWFEGDHEGHRLGSQRTRVLALNVCLPGLAGVWPLLAFGCVGLYFCSSNFHRWAFSSSNVRRILDKRPLVEYWGSMSASLVQHWVSTRRVLCNVFQRMPTTRRVLTATVGRRHYIRWFSRDHDSD